ncbi:MAG: helix-turn-helix domain-containing protein [Xanthobacteraceae bacterium]
MVERYKPQKFYLSAADLAERYGVHVITIFKWAKRGILPPGEKVGPNTRRWRRVAIEAFDAERATRAEG